jgi:hypothetical protein
MKTATREMHGDMFYVTQTSHFLIATAAAEQITIAAARHPLCAR